MTLAQTYSAQLRDHLRKHRPKTYRDLESRGQLESLLQERGESAAQMFDLEQSRWLELNPPPKEYQARLAHLGQAAMYAREVVNEMILLPAEEDDRAIRRGHYAD